MMMIPLTGGFAAPGSGTANITPSDGVTAGSSGEWVIEYTAAEPFSGGQISVVIPDSWSDPQQSDAYAAGYITVTSEGTLPATPISLSGKTITVSIDTLSAGETVTVVYGDDGISTDGRAVSQQSAETGVEFTVSSSPNGSSPQEIGSSPYLDVVAGSIESLVFTTTERSVEAGEITPVMRVQSVDQYGNPSNAGSDRTVDLSSGSATGKFSVDDGSAFSDTSSVVITAGKDTVSFYYRDNSAGDQSIAVSDALEAWTDAQQTVSVAAADPFRITAAPIDTTITAGDHVGYLVSIKDEFGNSSPVSSDQNIQLYTTGGSFYLTTDHNSTISSVTIPAGNSSVGIDYMSTEMDTDLGYLLIFSDEDGQAPALESTNTTVYVNSSAADTTVSTISSDLSQATADGAEEVTLTVVAKDGYGNPVSGSSVLFEVSGSGNSVVQPVGVTGSDGTATGTLSSTVAELKTVKGTIDGSYLSDSVQVEFNPGILDYFIITHDGNANAGEGENIQLEIFDSEGNRIEDYTGTIKIFTDTDEAVDRISWGIGTGTGVILSESRDTLQYQFAETDNGEVTFIFTDLKAEVLKIYAESGSVLNSSGDITIAHSLQDRITVVSGDDQRAVVNSRVPNPLAVRVVDEYSNPVDNAEVQFTVVDGGGSIDTDTLTAGLQSKAFTGVDGLAYGEAWVLGTVSGSDSDRISASITAGTVTSVEFTATSDHDQADALTLTPASGDVTVSSSTRVEAELRDLYGNLVTGQEIWLYIKDQADGVLSEDAGNPNPTTGHSPGTRSGTTDSTGTISVMYDAPASAGEIDVLDAYHSLVPADSVEDVEFATVASGATRLAVEQVSSDPAEAGETFSFKVKAEDSNGNLDPDNSSHISLASQPGSGIVFSLSDFGAEITEADLTSGELTVFARGEKEGDWNVHIEASGPPLTAVDFSKQLIPNSTIAYYTVSASSGGVAGENISIEVRAKDSFANFISDASRYIRLRAVSDADTTAASGNTLSVTEGNLVDGLFSTGALSYNTAEQIRVEITDTVSSIVKCSETIDIDHAAPFSIIELGGDSTMVTAGDSVLLRGAVEDNFGNRVDAEIVSFAVLEGGGNVTATQRSTRGDGTTSVGFLTGTEAGTNRVRGAILDGTPEGLETVMYEIQTVPATEIDYVELEYDGESFSAGETIQCSVSAFDKNGNLVAADSTTLLLPVSESAGMYFSPDTLTLSGGVASFNAVDTLSGRNRISIESISGDILYPFNQYITILPASAYEIVEISGDTTGVISGDTVELKAGVADRYGNVLEDEVVRFNIVSDLGGDPSLIDGTGDPSDGLVLTDEEGTAVCSLLTDTNTGINEVSASILDGDPQDRETVNYTVATSAGNISRYEISLDGYVQDAGAPFDADIVAYDLNNNIAYGDDTTRVLAGNSGAAVLSADTLTLTDGSATVTVIDSTAERIALSAQTLGGGALSYSDSITVLPGPPAGNIGIFSVVPDTITADGISRSAITTEPVLDLFDNTVSPGTEITVSTSAGTISSDDYNLSLPGVQRETAESGRVSVFVSSGVTPGDVEVVFASVEGSATGNAALIFAPAPDCRYGGYLQPRFVVPDSSVIFRSLVTNFSNTGVYISPSSYITFSDGTRTFSADLGETVYIEGSASDTLTFEQRVIPPGFEGGTYTPRIEIAGTDIYSSDYSTGFNAGTNSISVSTIEIMDITPEMAVLSRGDTTGISVTVKNSGGVRAIVQDLQLQFSRGDYSNVTGWTPSMNDTLNPGLARTYSRDIRVLPYSPTGSDTIDAIVHAVTEEGMDVYDYSADRNKGVFLIQSASRLSYQDGSFEPPVVSRGQQHGFSLSVENLGEAAVIINSLQTYIEFTDQDETYTAFSETGGALTGLRISELEFSPDQIPLSMDAGVYPVNLYINGSENGAVFDTSFVISDSVSVVDPADLQYIAETLNPVSVSKGSSVSFNAGIMNSGGAEISVMEDSTFIVFSDGTYFFRAYVQEQPEVTLVPGSTTVYFKSEPVPEEMATGTYQPMIIVRGHENGLLFDRVVNTGDTVTVQNPSRIAINRTTLPFRVTRDQNVSWEAVIELENNGEAPVRLDSISCRLFSGGNEVTGEYNITQIDFDPGEDVLDGGQVDSFRVMIEDNPENSMTTGMIVMESYMRGTDLNSQSELIATTESGGKGGFLVETPAVPVIEGISASVDKATAGQNRDWTIDVAVSNQGESDLDFDFDADLTYMTFSTSDDFALSYPSGFVSGDTVLGGGERDTIRVTVDVTGSVIGLCTLNIEGTATEINSGRIISPITAAPDDAAELIVQAPAQLVVTGVTPLQDPVTSGQAGQWNIDLNLENQGGSDVLLDIDNYDSTFVEIPQGSGFVFDYPLELQNGGKILPASETGIFRFSVSTTGSVPPGKQVLSGAVSGTEINSGDPVYYEYNESVSTDSMTFQLAPEPSYVNGSLLPNSASKGTDIQISAELYGGGSEYSTLNLSRSATYAYFTDAQGDTFRAVLSPVSGTVLQGGGDLLLTFESTRIDTSIADGLYQVQLHIQGYENGNSYQVDLSSSPDVISVEEAPRLSITSILTRSSVTASLQPPWDIKMVLHNTGEASVDLDLAETETFLTLSIPPAGDVTGQYDLTYPDNLEISGNSILPGNQVDTLVFSVQSTGTTTGTASINGHVTASDVNSGDIIADDTFSGGGSYVSIEQPGGIEITGTSLSQSTVTSGQNSPWHADVEITNTGEAEISLLPDSTYIYSDYILNVPSPPREFEEGGISLSGGESGKLRFTVTPTPETESGIDLPVYARAGVIEDNRSYYMHYDSGDEQSGYDSITLQTAPDLRVVTMENNAIRTPFVNYGQRFPLTVSVENRGEAEALGMELTVVGDGISHIESPVRSIAAIEGSGAVLDTFYVEASSQSGTETFSVQAGSAVDANSGESEVVRYSPAVDSTAVADIQSPGLAEVIELIPSQSHVNAGQTADWYLKAIVANSGEAPVTFMEPASGDLAFRSGAAELNDYLVTPPDIFMSGASDLTLDSGEIDSLEFVISTTGTDTGTVDMDLRLGWLDNNIPGSSREPAEGTSSVTVREPSGLRIISVTSSAPNSGGIPNTSFVNTGQEFDITVQLENTGGDALDSIRVGLNTDGGSGIVISDSTTFLDTGSEGHFVFSVTASGVAGVEILTAAIERAVSVNTGEEIEPVQAVESSENVHVQIPADLICSAEIISPQGAVDDTVSVGQRFTVEAEVSNAGEGIVDDSGELRIILPSDFTLEDSQREPFIRDFLAGEKIQWSVRCPATVTRIRTDTVSVEIYTRPLDANTEEPASSSRENDYFTLVTEQAASVTGCAVVITAPEGAVDGVLSTGQEFTAAATLLPSDNSYSCWVSIDLPEGYLSAGSLYREIGDGDGTERTVIWNLSAPDTEDSSPVNIDISSGGLDENSGTAFGGCSASFNVETERAALLNLSAGITGPDQALEGILSLGLPFTVGAEVINRGSAGIDTTGARLRIELPDGYVAEGSRSKPFYPGEPVVWNLRAPTQVTNPGNIYVMFDEPYAEDANTNMAAETDTAEVSIAVRTEAGKIMMENLSSDSIPPKVVPQGARDVPMMRIGFTNESVYTVGLDSIYFSISGANGNMLDRPGSVVDSIRLVTGHGVFSASANDENPVLLPVNQGFTVDSLSADTVMVELDISGNASVGGVNLEIAGSGDVVFTIGNMGVPVGVNWIEGGDIAGHFKNNPFTVMSGEFSEYAHNYPNPFMAGTENTRITYFLNEPVPVNIYIYDYTGILVWSKQVPSSEGGVSSPAWFEVEWDGRNENGYLVRNGVYICKIVAGAETALFKIAVAK